MSLEVIKTFCSQYEARFLMRKDGTWVVVYDMEIQRKIALHLRHSDKVSTAKKRYPKHDGTDANVLRVDVPSSRKFEITLLSWGC